MTALEIEVKFFLEDAKVMEKQVKALGAEFQKAVDETNIRFETRDNALFSNKSLLRLRRADQTTLTYKAETGQAQTDYKIHTEYEVTVDNFEMMHSILKSLGFHAAQVYEKHRTSYHAGE